VLFEIPAAPKGIPIAFEGHYYGRDGEELGPLNIEEFERIRAQVIREDWNAEIIPDATIDDLDPQATGIARENFKSKFPEKISEIDTWNTATFLNKAKITIKGKIRECKIKCVTSYQLVASFI
jgi:ATP-dependent DNA helicase RecG